MKKLSREQMRNVMGGNYQQICTILCCTSVDPRSGDCVGTTVAISSSTCDPNLVNPQCFGGSATCSCTNGPGY